MNMKDMQVEYLKEWVLTKVPLSEIIDANDIFTSGKTPVITYDGTKKIADYCWIVIKENPMFLVQPGNENKQQHIWWLWFGYKGEDNRDNWVFSEGEASLLNTGRIEKTKEGGSKHIEWGEVDSMYKSAMAYKRAYCRGVLRLAKLYGVYSAVEAQEFSKMEEQKQVLSPSDL